MNDLTTLLIVLSVLLFSIGAIYTVARVMKEAADAEAKRVADWWRRSQKHIDNLQDRVMSREFQVYAAATELGHPSDLQPSEEDDGVVGDMIRMMRQQAEQNEGFGFDPDVADDFPASTFG